MRSVFMLALLAGCGSVASSTLTAADELLLSSINGPEETLAARAAFGAVSTESDPDAPPLFHECNPDGFNAELFEQYDADHSGELEDAESSDVEGAHAGHGAAAAGHRHLHADHGGAAPHQAGGAALEALVHLDRRHREVDGEGGQCG